MSKAYRRLFGGAVVVVSLVAAGVATAAPKAGKGARTDDMPTAAPAAATPGSTTEGRTGQAGTFKAPSPIRPGEPISVLVFPFGFRGEDAGAAAPAGGAAAGGAEAPAGGAAAPAASGGGLTVEQQETAGYLTAAVKAGFLSTPWYTVATFSPISSLVQRARKDEILRPEHVTGVISTQTGAVDVDKARIITQRLSMQTLLVGTLEMTANPKTNSVELTVESQLLNSSTGEVIRAAAVSGSASGADGVAMSTLRERAALDAAQKIFPAMGIQLALPQGTTAAAEAPAKKKDKSQPKPTPKKEAKPEKAPADAKKDKPSASNRSHNSKTEQASAAPAPELRTAKVETVAQTDPPAKPAAEANPAAPAPAPASSSGGPVFRGEATATGQPIPYGYAMNAGKNELPKRSRGGLRVPPWLGVSAFLTGISFLIY